MASYSIGRAILYLTGAQDKTSDGGNTVPYTSRPCRFRLDDTTSSTFSLPDGRRVGYAEWGTPKSDSPTYTVFALHGLPGHRMEGAFIDDIAKLLSVRVIIPERPGYGLSDADTGYTTRSHAQDVLMLADHLGIKKYGVIGTSGGGPYCMACAYFHPSDRLLAVTNVVGMGETATMSNKGMAFLHWLGYGPMGYMRLARATSHRLVTDFFKLTEPVTRVEVPEEERTKQIIEGWEKAYESGKLPKAEMDLWQKLGKGYAHDLLRTFVHNAKEVWSTTKGCQAVTLDGANLASPWGFNVQDIRADLQVNLWYGKHDVNCPPIHGQVTAERLKLRGNGQGEEKTSLTIKDETHMSIQLNWQKEIWAELVASMEAASTT